MVWEDILKLLVTSGVLASIVGVLSKLVVKWLGHKLGWDETKRHKASALIEDAAEKAIRAAEQSAKHKKFGMAKDQALWKENYAIDMVMELTGIESGLAKSVLRSIFNTSDLNHKPKISHEEVHKFEDTEVNKVVEKLIGD